MKFFGRNRGEEDSSIESTIPLKMHGNEAYKELKQQLKEVDYTLSSAFLDPNMEIHIVAIGFLEGSPIIAVDYGELSVTTTAPVDAYTAENYEKLVKAIESGQKALAIIQDFLKQKKYSKLAII